MSRWRAVSRRSVIWTTAVQPSWPLARWNPWQHRYFRMVVLCQPEHSNLKSIVMVKHRHIGSREKLIGNSSNSRNYSNYRHAKCNVTSRILGAKYSIFWKVTGNTFNIDYVYVFKFLKSSKWINTYYYGKPAIYFVIYIYSYEYEYRPSARESIETW
jgi:hypothetical protein